MKKLEDQKMALGELLREGYQSNIFEWYMDSLFTVEKVEGEHERSQPVSIYNDNICFIFINLVRNTLHHETEDRVFVWEEIMNV